jgi:excisionase family DNA binding protein
MTSATLLTSKEVAALLRVHPKQVYRLLKRGLPAARVGDEWRFDREEVLRWAALADRRRTVGAVPTEAGDAEATRRPSDDAVPAADTGSVSAFGPSSRTPPLLAANGDCAIELVLTELRRAGGPLLGFILDDHAGAARLLGAGRVLVAGQHGGATSPAGAKWARFHLMTREVGLCGRSRSRQRFERALIGRRFASRPPTAGVRRRLDAALARAGTVLSLAYENAVELDSHRAVVLAVCSGQADIGLTTHAWAGAAGLQFQPLGSEAYELVVNAEQLGDPRLVALAELLQSARLRQRLRDSFGYGVNKTGELRIG